MLLDFAIVVQMSYSTNWTDRNDRENIQQQISCVVTMVRSSEVKQQQQQEYGRMMVDAGAGRVIECITHSRMSNVVDQSIAIYIYLNRCSPW